MAKKITGILVKDQGWIELGKMDINIKGVVISIAYPQWEYTSIIVTFDTGESIRYNCDYVVAIRYEG